MFVLSLSLDLNQAATTTAAAAAATEICKS
jgi:hypothetical protein